MDPQPVEGPQSTEAVVPPAKRSPKAVLIVIGLIVVLVGVGLPLILLQANNSSGSDDSANLVKACERSVRDQLLAPATVQFYSVYSAVVDRSTHVTGDFDSQDENGALARSSFDCSIGNLEIDASGSGLDKE
jgi:hypothetical protein